MDSLLATFASYKLKILEFPTNTTANPNPTTSPSLSPSPYPFSSVPSDPDQDSDSDSESIINQQVSTAPLPLQVLHLKMPIPRKQKGVVSALESTATPVPVAITEEPARREQERGLARRPSIIVPLVRHRSQVALFENCDDGDSSSDSDSGTDIEISEDEDDGDEEEGIDQKRETENTSPLPEEIASGTSSPWKRAQKTWKAISVFKNETEIETETGEQTQSISDYSISPLGTPVSVDYEV
ncbi:hypothetical protein BKA61DRAFT_680770 [Leptodontidium sp. MPI-SDFR-AT-0119]|nr:hypothetical protein BKA61DRAFT_680770 [Leptodontidium sp. MPI-SDFR-AT-0119]